MLLCHLVSVAPPPCWDAEAVLAAELSAVARGEIWREIATISSSSASFDPACVGFLWPRMVRTRQYSPQHRANIQFGLCGTCINGVEMK